MRPALRSWARLSRAERRLALRALALVAGFRLALWTLPARRVLGFAPRRRSARAAVPPERVARLVRAAGRRVPGASCLTRALAARWLLAEVGADAALRFGHRRDEQGRFAAHAWLELDGRVLVGGDEDLSSYHPFDAPRAASGDRPIAVDALDPLGDADVIPVSAGALPIPAPASPR